MTVTYDPDHWLTTANRALLDYMQTKLATELYDIVADYPSPDQMAARMPMAKTLVHFSLDDPRAIPFGVGDNITMTTDDTLEQEIDSWEARCHEVTYDIGIWASAETGGSTSRMEARELLDDLFHGSLAQATCLARTDGIDIRSFTGGRSVVETISDTLVYRMVDIALVVRLYSRAQAARVHYVNPDDLGYVPELTIDGDLTVSG